MVLPAWPALPVTGSLPLSCSAEDVLSGGRALLSGFSCGPSAQWAIVDRPGLCPPGWVPSGQSAMWSTEPEAASWMG